MVAGEREEGRSHGFPLFLLGLLFGVAGTIIVPRFLGPRLPGALRTGDLMEGRVLAKMVDGERLLLKVQTDEDVYLATFEQRQREIDLLVDRGDLVTLQVRGTDPFPMGPAIRRVRKTDPQGTPVVEPEALFPEAASEASEGPAPETEPDREAEESPELPQPVHPDSAKPES